MDDKSAINPCNKEDNRAKLCEGYKCFQFLPYLQKISVFDKVSNDKYFVPYEKLKSEFDSYFEYDINKLKNIYNKLHEIKEIEIIFNINKLETRVYLKKAEKIDRLSQIFNQIHENPYSYFSNYDFTSQGNNPYTYFKNLIK